MRYNKYRKPTVELLLKLLSNAYDKNEDLDKILYQIMEQAGADLANVMRELERRGKLNMG
jgi:phage shock protein A